MEVREELRKVCTGDDLPRQQRYSYIVKFQSSRAVITSDSNSISHIQSIVSYEGKSE